MVRGRAAVVVLIALCLAGSAVAAHAQQSRTVNFYNWSDYIDPTVLEAFTKETGIKVRYDTFDSNDTLETKLLAGKSGYDVVVPTGYFLERQIKAGVFLKLDKAKLPNLDNVWPEIARAARHLRSRQPVRRQLHVGHDRHRLQRRQGARGVRHRRQDRQLGHRVQAGEPGAVQGLRRAHARFVRRHHAGGAALSRPRSQHHRSRPICEKAANLLLKIRPSVRKFHSSEYLNALATGEICLVVGWSGDIKQAQKRAAEAKNGIEIGYAIPKEGAQMWFDNLAIPKDAKNVAEAHALINYPAHARGGRGQ